MSAARALRYLAFWPMALFGLLGTLFVMGYAFDDPGGWAAVALSAAWVVPMVTLAVLALRRPDLATPVLVALVVAVAVFTLLDHTVGIVPRDDWGPVSGIAVFAGGVVLAFLGLRRALVAGLLMVALATTEAVAVGLLVAVRETGEGPGPGALLGGSSGVMVVPILAVGALFAVAGLLGGEHLRPGRDRPEPPDRPPQSSDVPAGVS